MSKLYSVKANVFNKVEEGNVDFENINLKYPSVDYYKVSLSLVGNNLSWQDAKNLRKQFKGINASIFPAVHEEKLEVIEL